MTATAATCPPPSSWDWSQGCWLYASHDGHHIHIWIQTAPDNQPRCIAGYTLESTAVLVHGLADAVDALVIYQESLRQLGMDVEEIAERMNYDEDE
jgi:hypothetical protein